MRHLILTSALCVCVAGCAPSEEPTPSEAPNTPAAPAPVENSPLPDAAENALSTGTDVELFSLSPDDQENRDESQGFHGWEILGSTPIQDQTTRTKLLTAFRAGVEENDGSVDGCFDPRHGIRVKHDGKTFDFVICFTCYSVVWYVDDKQESEAILITDSPRGVFDGVLKTAKVPLPAPPN
jgi:hypothetical protein